MFIVLRQERNEILRNDKKSRDKYIAQYYLKAKIYIKISDRPLIDLVW